jgi:hypothetical protein
MFDFNVLCASIAVLLLVQAPASAMMPTGAEFCANLKSNNGKPNKTLVHVRESLGLCHVNALGKNAKDAKPHFESFGFKDAMGGDKAVLAKADALPEGAVFILDKKAGEGCPISQPYGRVAVKCGANQLQFGPGEPPKALAEFVKENPECIKAIMVHSSWEGTHATSVEEKAAAPRVN